MKENISDMTYAHETPDMAREDGSTLLDRPAVALLAAGAIGFAVGAVIWQYRRTHPQKFGTFDRAVDMARSGAADTIQKLRRRLREEGYSPAEIEGRAKKYLSQLIDAAQSRF
jgi:microsomal dipeptidase-like Zn-dependent dipeptidase